MQKCLFPYFREILLPRWTLVTNGYSSFTLQTTHALPGSNSFQRRTYLLYTIKKHISKMQKCLFPYFREILLPRWTLATSGHPSFTLQTTLALPGCDSFQRRTYIIYTIENHISRMQKCLFPYFREKPTERVFVTLPRQHIFTCCEKWPFCVDLSSETFVKE